MILKGVLYFCRSGGLAELVDCTGLENRRAARYRGFESLSLRLMKRPQKCGRFFVLSTASIATMQSIVTRLRANLVCDSKSAQILSHANMASSVSSVRFSRDDFWRIVGHGLVVWAAFGLSANMHAQTSWIGDVLIQRLPDGQAYAEVQTAWTSTAETASDSLTLTMIAFQGDEIVSFQKDKVLARPEVQDSSALRHVHVARLAVPQGGVRVEWLVAQNETPIWQHNAGMRVPVGGMPEFTDVMVVNTHAPATAMSQPNMVHSGLDLIPKVGNAIPVDATSARFYVELHGLNEVVPTDSLFLLKFGWADENGQWNPGATRYLRKSSAPIVPVFEVLPCTPTSPTLRQPVMKLEAQTRNGHVVVSRDVTLGDREWPQGQPQTTPSAPANVLLPSLNGYDSLAVVVKLLEDHLAMATTNEQSSIQQVLIPSGDVELMKRYISGFWMDRSSSVPESEAMLAQYLERIAHVDEKYGQCKYGQGSLTEMGNIYLRFGKPNTVVKRHHETDYYPYEIWHYHKAGRFNNKRFLFFAPHVVGECFELLHSDMLGERQNEDWLSQLRSRENTVQVSKSMENRLNPRDTFSGEEPEDLFFNPR